MNAVYSALVPQAAPRIAGNTCWTSCLVYSWTNAGTLVAAQPARATDGQINNLTSFYQTAARTTAMIGISVRRQWTLHSL